ncbi:MAG TPA: PQQ-binding-like beta-propeller repeat protein [Opitutus sp.]|nr:PQQ-binding-like beta-propeller repeat protein [Opitutus sp.]
MTNPTRCVAILCLVAANIGAAAVAPRFTDKELAQGYADAIILARPRADHAATVDAAEAGEGITVIRHFPRFGGARVLRLRAGDNADAAIARLRASGRYDYVERDALRHARAIPNDPSFSQQWSLRNTGQSGGASGADIGATTAWDTNHDASGVIVAVIDSGARLTHNDLAANLWTNSSGYHGINSTVSSGSGSYNNPADDEGHGTHVSGIIGAVGNNSVGISGVAWSTQLMELKFLDSTGYGDTADEVECLNYAIAHGASVINASFGGGPYSTTEFNALQSARDAGIIVVVAAGNDSANNDIVTDYPSGYPLDNIVAVAATTRSDKLDTNYSNYGCGSVELGAPGSNIYSTFNGSNSDYQTLSGTSMAAPHVVGAIALLRTQFPGDTYRQTINRLLRSVTPLATLSGKVQTGGRLNLAAALASTSNRPFNDNFADRAKLSGVTIHVRSNNVGATAESGEPALAGVTAAATLWWTWTATGVNNVRIDTSGSAYDTVLAVYTGSSLNALTPVASNDDSSGTTSAVTFTSQANTTYQIAVGGKAGATGYTALAISSPPGNDDFASAATLSGVSISQAGTTLNATSETHEPDPTSHAAGNSVWYKWTAPSTGHFTLAAFSTQVDTVAAVYTGSSLASLSLVSYNDNSSLNSSNSDALVSFTATASTTYYFQVDHSDSDGTSGGDFILTLADSVWEYPAADQVTSPPAVAADGTVYFGAGSSDGYDKKIYAVNSTGTTKWTVTTNSTGVGVLDSAPAIGADGTVYIGASDKRFYALNPGGGAKKWYFTAATALGSAPAIAANGTIYFRDNTTLYSLTDNGTSYTKNWTFTLTGSTSDGTYCSPSIGADGTIYVGTNAGAFYAVNPNGTQKWKYTADDDIFTTPAIATNGNIYFATLSGTVYALSSAGSKLWSWSTTGNTSVTSSIALDASGNLYFAGYDHKLHALSSSGSELWSYTLGDEVRACSPAIASDGTIYIGCYDGFLYAINADGTLQRTYATAQTIRSSPVIAGQRLYFGSADAKLHAFDLAHGVLSSAWPMFHRSQSRTGRADAAASSLPTIDTQPSSQTATVGDNVTFTVAASGTAPLTYQWRKDTVAIGGATNTTLTLSSIASTAAGSYDVVVTNGSGSVTSNAATLTVNKAAATVTLSNLAQTYTGAGHSATAATSPQGLTVAVTYGGSSTLPVNAGSYAVVATVNDTEYAGSASGQLVIAKAALTARADDKSKPQGTANPTLTITYTGLVTGDTAAVIDTPPSISTTATTASPAGTYPITLTGGSDNNYTLTRVNGTLTVTAPTPPVITTEPVSQTVAEGASVSFTVAVTSSVTPTYQWLKNDAPITGATGDSYAISAVQSTDAGTYTVVVTNPGGSTTSSPAALTVTPAPTAPEITTQPESQAATAGGSVSLSAAASSDSAVSFQWQRDGAALSGATASTLALTNLAPADAGIYTAAVTNANGTTVTKPVIVGVTTTAAVAGAGSVVGANVVHPNGNIYDQVLLQGSAAAITVAPGHVTRISFIDLADNIVQVEFSGAGTLSLVLDDPSGPAAPLNYNQPDVAYMKGHAHIVVVGADATTNVSVFAVGRATAFDPTGAFNFLLPISPTNSPANNGSPLFAGHATTEYSGIAGIASIAVLSTDGHYGGIRTADGGYFASTGLTGIYAPDVDFTGPVFVGNIDAFDSATPVIQLGAVTDARVTGGDLFQDNGAAVQVSGLTQLHFTAGGDANGTTLPAQSNRAVLEQDGVDVTSQIVVTSP